jgi:hypothetical protein
MNERRSESDDTYTRTFFDKAQMPFYSFVLRVCIEAVGGWKDGVQRFVNVLRYLLNVTNSLARRRIGLRRQTALPFLGIFCLLIVHTFSACGFAGWREMQTG